MRKEERLPDFFFFFILARMIAVLFFKRSQIHKVAIKGKKNVRKYAELIGGWESK